MLQSPAPALIKMAPPLSGPSINARSLIVPSCILNSRSGPEFKYIKYKSFNQTTLNYSMKIHECWFAIFLPSPVALQVSGLKGSTLTYLSLEPVASNCPQGLQATQYMEPLWCLFLLKRIAGGLFVPEPLRETTIQLYKGSSSLKMNCRTLLIQPEQVTFVWKITRTIFFSLE